MYKNNQTGQSNGRKKTNNSAGSRGASMRAQARGQEDAAKIVGPYMDAANQPKLKANMVADAFEKLKVTFLGGLDDVGEKNMAVIEYRNEAIILDCGNNLSIELPGINYEINDTAYLETIKHKIKAYVITHGHLDHMGGLHYTVPLYPAPIYGSAYTIGIIEKSFEKELVYSRSSFKPQLVLANIDNHERLKVGSFTVEFIRVTHSLPDAAAVCIDTPMGRIIATGDFRLDPEPLDRKPTDIKRLKELGNQGVLLLLSESSYADIEGRVLTESTLQRSFYDIIGNAPGRIFVAAFSSNMNRSQMIINAAVAAGRKVALDGRGMLSYAEIAVRQGILKVPQGTIIPMQQASTIPAGQVLVMCTGGQGEPNAALQRMSQGEHKNINLEPGDTVVISSSPIPGNEVRYDAISNRLARIGVRLFRHPTFKLDGCGPLHVSGHAQRGELKEMLELTRPKFFIPVHGGSRRRSYHAELSIAGGIPRKNALLPENGDCFFFTANSVEQGGKVPYGSLLMDQAGSVVSGSLVKDRLMLSESGIVTMTLTINKQTSQLVGNPSVLSNGFVGLSDKDDFTKKLLAELSQVTRQKYGKVSLEQFENIIKDCAARLIFKQIGRCPVVVTAINEV